MYDYKTFRWYKEIDVESIARCIITSDVFFFLASTFLFFFFHFFCLFCFEMGRIITRNQTGNETTSPFFFFFLFFFLFFLSNHNGVIVKIDFQRLVTGHDAAVSLGVDVDTGARQSTTKALLDSSATFTVGQ